MAGSWDFTADSEIQTELSNSLNEAADKFDGRVSDMYTEIDSLGSNNYWVGEDYNEFNTGTHGYENALKDLSEGIRMYGKHFSEMATGTDSLATELISIVQNMTGSGNGGGTTGGTTGGTSGGSSGTSTGDNSNTTASNSGSTGAGSSSGNDDGSNSGDSSLDNGSVSAGTGGAGGGAAGSTGTGDSTGNNGTVAIEDPASADATQEGDQEQTRSEEVGSRYVNDWNEYTASLGKNFSNVDGVISATFSDIAITQSQVSGLTDKLGTFATTSALTAAIAGLDKTDAAVANQYVTAVSETDGVISVTRKQISYNELADKPAIATPAAGKLLGADGTEVFNANQTGDSTIIVIDCGSATELVD